MLEKSPLYRSYLLRCWAEQGYTVGHPGHWRFSLEDPHTAERHGFVSLAGLVTFLEGELAGRDGQVLDRERAPPTIVAGTEALPRLTTTGSALEGNFDSPAE